MTKNKIFRIALPVILILIWLGLASLGGPTFGKISDVTTNDRAAFLPSSAESTRVQELQTKYQKGQSLPAIIILEADKAFTSDDLRKFSSLTSRLSEVDGVEGRIIGPIPSEDGRALEFITPVSSKMELKEVVGDLRSEVNKGLPQGTLAYVTGPAGLGADLSKAFGGIDGILLAVALTAVFIILLIVYRSVLLPLLVLLNAVFALCAAILVVYLMAKNNWINLNGQSQGILSILVIGAATDYSLLFVSRYREALEKVDNKWEAIWRGVKGSFEPILASAATVIIALLCLLFSDLNSNRSLGPIAATGIVFSFLATLSFLPTMLALFGTSAFWPSKIRTDKTNKQVEIRSGLEELSGVWKRVGNIVISKARFTWLAILLSLSVASLGLFQLKASGVPQTDIILTSSNAADGQKAISRHFSAGSGVPTLIAVPAKSIQQGADLLNQNKNFTEIMVYTDRGPNQNLDKAKIIDGQALLAATLTVDPYSPQGENAIAALRKDMSSQIPGSLVGGTTALDLDTSTTSSNDFKKIVPIVLFMIFIVLALLFRALIAPIILILTVVLSFAATIGISALVFNNAFNFPGADATVPLFGFVFLVALGVDYNIFLISRTREEALKYGTSAAILHSLGKTGGVITSAGIVLAATFAALGIIPILFLAQLAFIVAFGVLLDTFIVRSLLVPALFKDIGPRVWWPSKLNH